MSGRPTNLDKSRIRSVTASAEGADGSYLLFLSLLETARYRLRYFSKEP